MTKICRDFFPRHVRLFNANIITLALHASGSQGHHQVNILVPEGLGTKLICIMDPNVDYNHSFAF